MQRLWTEYVRHGAIITKEPSVFGEKCPEPQFERARKMAAAARAWHWPRLRKRTYAGIAALVIGLGLVVAVLAIRRHRARPR